MRVPSYVPNVNMAPMPGPNAPGLPSGYFGEENAQSLQRAGLQLAGTGQDAIALSMKWKADDDALKAKAAFVSASDEVRNLMDNDILKRQGLNTDTAVVDTDKSLVDIYKKNTEQLSDAQRGAFDSFWGSLRGNTLDTASHHRRGQMDSAQDQANSAIYFNAINNAGRIYNDENVAATSMQQIDETLKSEMLQKGLDKSVIQAKGTEMRTQLIASRISGALAGDNVPYAQKIFDASKDKLDAKTQQHFGALIKERGEFDVLKKEANIDAVGLLDKIVATDKDGKFTYRPEISDDSRFKIKGYAQQVLADNENKQMNWFYDRLNNGEIPKESEISAFNMRPDLKNRMVNMAQRLSEERDKNASEAAGTYSEAMTEEKQLQYAFMDWPASEDERRTLLNQELAQITDPEMGYTTKQLLKLRGDLMQSFNNAVKPSSQTQLDKEIAGYLKKQLDTGNLYSDPWGLFNKVGGDKNNLTPFEYGKHVELLDQWKTFHKNNPDIDKSPEKAFKWIQDKVKDINDGKAVQGLQNTFMPSSINLGLSQGLVSKGSARSIVKTGTDKTNGRTVNYYSDGSAEYAK